MNSRFLEPMVYRQGFQEWMPLITQQMRLRSVQQILAYNIQTESNEDIIYFTLHQSVMSAPFYTSEKLIASSNPKFKEFQLIGNGQGGTVLSSGTVVLRIWLRNASEDGMDSILLTWGVNLSGLVYLGTKKSAIQPDFFHSNTLIFVMRSSGYFTHHLFVKPSLSKPLPFIDSINVQSNTDNMYVYRLLYLRRHKAEINNSYSVEKLRHLRLLQLRLRNRTLDTENLRRDLTLKNGEGSMRGISDNVEKAVDSFDVRKKDDSVLVYPTIRYAPQLLTMNTLNKMLQIVPTKLQKHQIKTLMKDIECAKAVNRLLINERDKKTAQVRKLKEKYSKLYDDHEELHSQLMETRRQLNKDIENIKNQKLEQVLCKELLKDELSLLTTRRGNLLLELLELYPILITNGKFYINGVHLPNSDALNDINDDSISIALGYVAHVLKMYEFFLQIPLRYGIIHSGSQSYIGDHITSSIKDRKVSPQNFEEDNTLTVIYPIYNVANVFSFPLFTRGKDRIQFNYAVYLLNKNIAQLRWLHGQNTPNLRSTLPNLLDLLSSQNKYDINNGSTQSRSSKDISGERNISSVALKQAVPHLASNMLSTPFDQQQLRTSIMSNSSSSSSANYNIQSRRSVTSMPIMTDTSEIFAISEAYLTHQLSERSLHRYVEQMECANIHWAIKSNPKIICDPSSTVDNLGSLEIIEEGTDILALSLQSSKSEALQITTALHIPHGSNVFPIKPRLSRSVGSDDEQLNHSVQFGTDSTLHSTRYNIDCESAVNEDLPKSQTLSLSDTAHTFGIQKQEVYLRQWLETGPALICSEEHLYPDEVLGVTAYAQQPSTSTSSDTPLTARTNALLTRKTFNMVKPKH